MQFEPGERVEISGKTGIVLDYQNVDEDYTEEGGTRFYTVLMLDSGRRIKEPYFKLQPLGESQNEPVH